MTYYKNITYLLALFVISFSIMFFVHEASAVSVVTTIPFDTSSDPDFITFDSSKNEMFVTPIIVVAMAFLM